MLPSAPVLTRPVAALLLLLSGCGVAEGPRPVHRPPSADELPPEQAFLDEIDRARGTRDCFEVIRDPLFVSADGPHGIAPGEIVVGVDLGTAQFAYPIQLLNFHEIVEHTVEGVPLLVCW
jgi:hypothetical protein